ncbi:hypothetical protein [Geosporobacter ferrireducens]|uniref:Major tropism determinant N-terminal domain-containing protein n=1 Tax=Geosporobacter ferrireducens TaxID=1424294 RepID=A0A1D8GIE5_9FIRM|nr:hypothetical protein [Geosporobacter ferrireducens]AOT70679.1 hypothetical protein Gferi_14515 [Geosporobacter ferrireducens]
MADKNIQIKQRNAENSGWDNLYPKTKGSLVEVTGGSVEQHVTDGVSHVSSTDRSSWNTAKTHSDSSHAPVNAQKNSDITKAEIEAKLTGVITSHSHASGTPTAHKDTHLTGGSDAIPPVTTSIDGLMSASDKAKLEGIGAGANNYVHPTTAGNKHIPTGGATGQVLKYGGSSGTASWGAVTAAELGAQKEITVSATAPSTPIAGELFFEVLS